MSFLTKLFSRSSKKREKPYIGAVTHKKPASQSKGTVLRQPEGATTVTRNKFRGEPVMTKAKPKPLSGGTVVRKEKPTAETMKKEGPEL